VVAGIIDHPLTTVDCERSFIGDIFCNLHDFLKDDYPGPDKHD
jgi:hypothetical protein